MNIRILKADLYPFKKCLLDYLNNKTRVAITFLALIFIFEIIFFFKILFTLHPSTSINTCRRKFDTASVPLARICGLAFVQQHISKSCLLIVSGCLHTKPLARTLTTATKFLPSLKPSREKTHTLKVFPLPLRHSRIRIYFYSFTI